MNKYGILFTTQKTLSVTFPVHHCSNSFWRISIPGGVIQSRSAEGRFGSGHRQKNEKKKNPVQSKNCARPMAAWLINEAQTQLNNREHYKPLEDPMVMGTSQRVTKLVTQMHKNNFIDDMTRKWFSQTRNPPRTPIFYTLTKIHKPNPVRRPIILGCEGPTERLSFFVDKLLQPIAQQQRSYLKNTTDFINFIEKTKVSQNTILVSMDVTSLYTNIPQEEGIKTVCKASEKFHNYKPPIPSHYLKDMLGLILKENSFQFMEGNFLQTHGKNGSCICQNLHGGYRT